MTKAALPPLEVTIPLAFPVTVKDAEGKEAERAKLVMRRPKTRHAKRLAVVIGADLARMLLSDDTLGDDGELEIDMAEVGKDLVASLMSADRLDALTEIIADMCGEKPELIDELDPLDLFELGKGFIDFFPSLKSFGSTTSGEKSPPSTDGGQPT